MKTPLHKRTVPHGYQESYNPSLWNVGHLFTWSEPFGEYVLQSNRVGFGAVSVRPGETVGDALHREGLNEPDIVGNYPTLFFSAE